MLEFLLRHVSLNWPRYWIYQFLAPIVRIVSLAEGRGWITVIVGFEAINPAVSGPLDPPLYPGWVGKSNLAAR
jgi:hypothetical protein